MSSRPGRCCGSDPVIGLGSDPVLGGSGLSGAGLVSVSGPGSGCGSDSGSVSRPGTVSCLLGVWTMSGPGFVLDSGPVLFGGGPDFELGSGLAFLVLIPSGPDLLDLDSWP